MRRSKKLELVGPFRNGGRELRPTGEPELVRMHDFVIPALGRASPYGVYDLAQNEAWVSVGDRPRHGRLRRRERSGQALNHSLPPNGGNAWADVGWILIDGDEDVTPDTWFFESGPTDIEQLGGIAWDAQQQEEAAICRSAKTTGFRCGLIKNTKADKWVCDSDGTCWDLLDVHTMSKDAQGGDSGGLYRMSLYGPPWYYGAAGVHSHSSEPGTCDDSAGECRAWYTTVERLENQTILTVCASGRCDDIP
jgi:hypothetical protein